MQLALREEALRRREADPLRSFAPHKKQKSFIEGVLSRKYRRAFFLAANRAGKSDAGAAVVAEVARFGWPDGRGTTYYHADMTITDRATSIWASSLDWPSSRDICQPKLFDNGHYVPGRGHEPFIPKREIQQWLPSQQVLKLKSGSIIGFKSNDSGREKYQGTGKDLVWFDEEHDKEVYQEASIRVEAGRSLTVIVTCTMLPPEGVPGGVTWTFDEIVRPWQKGLLPDVLVTTASIYDNPHIGSDEIRFLESLYPPGSFQRRIRLDGELIPGTSGSRAYTAFNRELHVREQEEYWNPRRPLIWCWDFNIDPLITIIGQRDGRIFRTFDEFVTEDSSIAENCDQVFDVYGRHRGEWLVYGDATGGNRTVQTAESSYNMIVKHMRPKGVVIRLRVPKTNPAVRDRVNAINHALMDEHRLVNVEVDPRCEELIADLEQVQLDKRGGIRKVTNRSDPYYKRTHACLAGETRVSTPTGTKALQDLLVGYHVMTPLGTRKVLHAGAIREAPVFEVELSNGRTLVATQEHKFFTSKGLALTNALSYGIELLDAEHALCHQPALNSRAESIGYRAATIERIQNATLTESDLGLDKRVHVIAVRRLPGRRWVYDITVEHDQCYFANGVLVSNSDAWGYWVAYEAPVVSQEPDARRGPIRVRDGSYATQHVPRG